MRLVHLVLVGICGWQLVSTANATANDDRSGAVGKTAERLAPSETNKPGKKIEKDGKALSLDEARSLNQQAVALINSGDSAKAIEILERVIKLGEHVLSATPKDLGATLCNLGMAYRNLGRLGEAGSLMKRGVSLAEKAIGPDHVDLQPYYLAMVGLYLRQGRDAEAAPFARRLVANQEKAHGPDHPDVADVLYRLADIYHYESRYSDAEPLLKRALAIAEKNASPDDLLTSTYGYQLSRLYREEGRFDDAEVLLKRCLAIREKAHGPDAEDVAGILNDLGIMDTDRGRLTEAGLYLQRSLAIREKVLGSDKPQTAVSLANLGLLYQWQGRYADAEPLFKRAVTVLDKTLGPDRPQAATARTFLAQVYILQERYADAESLLKTAVAMNERALGPGNSMAVGPLNTLATVYRLQDRYADAEPVAKRAVAIAEKAFGPDHPAVATIANNLAMIYAAQGRYSEAEPWAKRSLAIREKLLGPDHPSLALTYNTLADVDDHKGLHDEAIDFARRAEAIAVQYSTQSDDDRTGSAASERQLFRDTFARHIHVLANTSSINLQVVDEAFRAAQYAGGVDTAGALAGMTARFAAGSDELATLVRERQDLVARWRALNGKVLKAMSEPREKHDQTIETALRSEQAEADTKLKAIDARLRTDFPRYADLTASRPASVAEIQSVLGPDEAFAAVTLADKESYLFVIRKDAAQLFKLALRRKDVADTVQSLRKSLAAATPFDNTKSYELYKGLFGPADAMIADAKNLIFVPDGALQSLPPSVLVTAPPDPSKVSDSKSTAWLIRRQAVTVLPAASSLIALRRLVEVTQARSPFMGFGDPDFRGDRGKRGIETAALFRGADADIATLRTLPRLEETAGELRAEAEALDAPASSIHLGADASVTTVRQLDLSSSRVIAFATHGLIAGDLPDLAEPALVLTPPAKASADDDGLLRASQVAKLKLNSDLVILSACNTASSDGKPGAEGLSGLAKAFFYAGARSLLVSHWPVESEPTVKLTTGLVRAMAADPSIGRAEALRRSILAMIDQAAPNSDEARPSAWAPFILAGEGGAGR